MTKEQYENITEKIKATGNLEEALRYVNIILTLIVYISYPALCAYLLFFGRDKLLRCVAVPGIMFVLVSVFRRLVNRARPYEKLGFTPVILKDKSGQSMPSRHVFSVFVIAMTFLYVFPYLSIPFFVIGVVLALVRVCGGVHYPSDVLVGAGIGLLSGFIGYYLI